ncbi:MAG: Glyoxalase/bleomycin resistance protein/dioxygenase [Friedmanniella sp.]|nr:Glyoxalase/bleomycin resistance protein/dioxygenase [Friedmanniella sp.]
MEQPQHGELGYLQMPSSDPAASRAFYGAVFGWEGESSHRSFTAPGLHGQWCDRPPGTAAGPVLWLWVQDLTVALEQVAAHGGEVLVPPQLDQGARWLSEVADPSGNRLGLVGSVEEPTRTGAAGS